MANQTEELKKAGLKATLPRIKIMEVLASTALQEEAHFSAEDIYRELISQNEDIGLATIYRVLTQFESAGMVTKHHFENSKAVYEINSDEHHDHMVDVDTGKVLEFHDEELVPETFAGVKYFMLSTLLLLTSFTHSFPEAINSFI